MLTNQNDVIAVSSSMFVYDSKPKVLAQLKKLKVKKIKFHSIKSVDMQFVTFEHNGAKWLTVRGTKGQADVATDLNVFKYDLLAKKIWIRRKKGKKFYKAYKQEKKRLKRLMRSMKLRHLHFGGFQSAEAIYTYLNKNKIQVTHLAGHSLGGLVATILAMFLKGLEGITTFGSPRAGGISFARKYNKKYKKITRRFFNDKDIVPKLPLRIMFFMHVANGLFFDHRGDLHNRMEQFRDYFSYFRSHKLPDNIKAEVVKYAKNSKKKVPEFLSDHFLNKENPLGYYRNVLNNMV